MDTAVQLDDMFLDLQNRVAIASVVTACHFQLSSDLCWR